MVQANRIKTVGIVGCTAVGKSDTAIKLAKRFAGCIIGADSMQIYKGFDIGTGKVDRQTQKSLPHYMIDVAEGDADYSVGEYCIAARECIETSAKAGKLPFVVGGTGLYVLSLFSGNDFGNAPKDESVRTAFKIFSHFFGAHTVHRLLCAVDPESAEKIAENDVKRAVRALEIYMVTGKSKSSAVGRSERPFDDLTIVLTLPRDILYERINKRVKSMFDAGLIDECKRLIKYKDCKSMQALGYKQIIENPDMDEEKLIELVAQKTRNYAKRQITFFKNMNLNKVFIDARDYEGIENTIVRFIGEK